MSVPADKLLDYVIALARAQKAINAGDNVKAGKIYDAVQGIAEQLSVEQVGVMQILSERMDLFSPQF